MALPTLNDLEAAFDAGYNADLDAKNPHFFCTALWIEWNLGQSVNWRIKQHRPRPQKRYIVKSAAVVILAIVAAIGAQYALL